VRGQVATHGGSEIDAIGDGFLIAFASPRRGIACAIGILDEVLEPMLRELGGAGRRLSWRERFEEWRRQRRLDRLARIVFRIEDTDGFFRGPDGLEDGASPGGSKV
jgi:hypothetical protein